jgi:hypothetical protein
MRTRTLLLFFTFQLMLVGLGSWAQTSGGTVWLLVMLVVLCSTAGARLFMQAEVECGIRPLEEEIKVLKAISKAPTGMSSSQADPGLGAQPDLVLLQRIAQLEAEMRLLCPPGGRQNTPVELPALAGVLNAE